MGSLVAVEHALLDDADPQPVGAVDHAARTELLGVLPADQQRVDAQVREMRLERGAPGLARSFWITAPPLRGASCGMI